MKDDARMSRVEAGIEHTLQGAEATLLRLVHFSALATFEQLFSNENIALENEVARVFPVLGEKMGIILLAAENLRIVLKSHFDCPCVESLVKKRFENYKKVTKLPSSEDFIKELLNQTTGKVKTILSSVQINAGISLPIVISGFDEVFSKNGNLSQYPDWVIRLHNVHIRFSLEVRMSDVPTSMQILKLPLVFSEETECEIEML